MAQNVFNTTGRQEYDAHKWHNRLIYGDNLLAMQGLILGDKDSGLQSQRDKIDLIYIDPPYDSKADYRTKITLPNSDIEQKPNVLEQFAYSDTWRDGTISYLRMIYPRLSLMRELLSERGSIYVHLDWHIGHYVKILMDSIFGRENFVNEIVWHYKNASRGKNRFAYSHDTIFWYSKNNDYIFNVDDVLVPFESGMTEWRYTKGGQKEKEMPKGKIPDDIISMASLNAMSNERTGYLTQKPEALLERIIKASSCGGGGIQAKSLVS